MHDLNPAALILFADCRKWRTLILSPLGWTSIQQPGDGFGDLASRLLYISTSSHVSCYAQINTRTKNIERGVCHLFTYTSLLNMRRKRAWSSGLPLGCSAARSLEAPSSALLFGSLTTTNHQSPRVGSPWNQSRPPGH